MGDCRISTNRDRLFTEKLARSFFRKVLAEAEWQALLSDEHFSVDGTLIEAWASSMRFVKKDGSTLPPPDEGRNPSVEFKGVKRSNATHASTTDPAARLYKKSEGDKSRLCYMGHVRMENRPGRVVDVEITQATGTAQQQAAVGLIERTIRKSGAPVGADRGY